MSTKVEYFLWQVIVQLEQLLAKQGKGQYNGGELRNLQNHKN